MTEKEIEAIESICMNDRRYEEYLQRMESMHEEYNVPHPAVVWFEATMLVMVLKQIDFGHIYAFKAWGNGKSDDEAYAVKWATLFLLRNGDNRFCNLENNVINSLEIDVDDYWFYRRLRKKRTPKGRYDEEVECFEGINAVTNKVSDICIPNSYKPADITLMKRAVRNVMDLCVNDIRCMTSTLNIISYYNEVSNGMFSKEMMTVSDMINSKMREDVGMTERLDLECRFDEEQVKRSGITKMPKIVLAVMDYMLNGKYRLKYKGQVSFDDMAVAFYSVMSNNDRYWKGTKQQFADMMKDLFEVEVKVKTMSRWIERNGEDFTRWGGRTVVSSKRSRLAEEFQDMIYKVSSHKVMNF